jgi:uncharacterized OB-fold protein
MTAGPESKPLSELPGSQHQERPPRPRPAPVPDGDSIDYWRGAHEGRLLVQRCRQCGNHQLYPRDRCISCRGDVDWVEASGRGTVYTFTVIRQNHSRPFRDMIPYVVALVDLDEGPRLMTNVVGCETESMEIGMEVRAEFEPVSEECGIAVFRPSSP